MYVGNHQFRGAGAPAGWCVADLRTPAPACGSRAHDGSCRCQAGWSRSRDPRGSRQHHARAGTTPAPSGRRSRAVAREPPLRSPGTDPCRRRDADPCRRRGADPRRGRPSRGRGARSARGPRHPGLPSRPAPPRRPRPHPGTAQFQSCPRQGHHSKLNTVKFLQAVQPAPGSPLAPAEPRAGGHARRGDPRRPEASQPVVDQLRDEPGTGAPAGTPGVADQALSQAAPPGASCRSAHRCSPAGSRRSSPTYRR
jgi:hypothetical protein